MSGNLAMGNNKITGLGTPTATTDATNKTYVDGILGSATAAASSASAAATSASNAATSETNAASSASAAAADRATVASLYDSFDDRYLGPKSSAPTQDNDGNALVIGALYFNSTNNIMYVYGSGGWQAAGSSVNGTSDRQTYTATSGQTVFASTYDAGYVDVYLNGVKLLAGTDFTATNGTSVTLASGASVNDVVDIVAYGTFVLADHLTETQSDAKYVEVAGDTMTGDLSFGDNDKAIFGAGSDLEIYHSGAGSFISDVGNGALHIRGTNLILQNGDGTKRFLDGNDGGAVEIHHGDATNGIKLATTSTGVDITGTLTSDGLTVDTNTLHVDATNNRVGIGTISPESTLEVRAGSNASLSNGVGHIIVGPDSRTSLSGDYSGGILFTQANGSQGGKKGASITGYQDGGDVNSTGITFNVHDGDGSANRFEAMRIDSSGNLILGGTSAGQDGAVTLSNTGYIQARIDNDTVAYFDRTGAGDDGEVIRIQQNGATVGSIGSRSSAIYIGRGDTGISFTDNDDAVYPVSPSGLAIRDAAIDLGISNVRFKDLYLSGGVYLGGTGSANKLDDYEEGTWTPVVYNANTSGHVLTLNNVIGKYKKIGNWVNCTLQVGRNDATSLSGIIVFANLPFTVAAQGSVTGGTFWLDKTSSDRIGVVYVVPSADRFYLLSDHAADNYLLMSEWQNSRPIYIQVSYNSA